MKGRYVKITEPFDTKHNTWIIAFCPDTDSFFVTNERCFFWEFEEEFGSEESAIHYFESHSKYFVEIEKEIMRGFCDKFKDINKIWLENTGKWYSKEELNI